VRPSQLAWYGDNVAAVREANGGRLARAVAFFHIPIVEYTWARERVGTTHEGVYHPDLNSGLYTAFVEAGDVIATVVGHDHSTRARVRGCTPLARGARAADLSTWAGRGVRGCSQRLLRQVL
jgi:hypothetical protein